jgi:very-short-patch-repair endonuclease
VSDVPWLQLVRFHREIAKRAERGLFSFNPEDDQGDRWSSFEGFDEGNLAGPWRIQKESIKSRPFMQSLRAGEFQSVFLGGPCYVGRERAADKKWYDRWQPVLYREVALREDDDGWELSPTSGIWAASPLFIEAVGRREAFPTSELDALASRLVEKAGHFQDEPSPVRRAIDALLPELREILDRTLSRSPRGQPSPWVLFAPTRSFSPLVRHLINDYDGMEQHLATADSEIGGLRAIEGDAWNPPGSTTQIMPLVPLNESQERAVRAMLSGDLLTVVGGPPGCGKSQVVVSLLLNAWASGQSVLFASNNNRAVDVVRERLERFDAELPICVRAGNKEANRVQEALHRVLNAAQLPEDTGRAQAEKTRSKLIKRRAALEGALATRVPQRIDESLRAGLRLYGEHKQALANLAEQDDAVASELRGIGLSGRSIDYCIAAVEETRIWIDDLIRSQAAAQDHQQRAQAERIAAAEFRRQRDAAIAAVGGEALPDGDWVWLTPGPGSLERWVNDTALYLQRPLENGLSEPQWDLAWDRWRDQEAAQAWSCQAEGLSQTIRRFAAESKAKVAEIAARSAVISAVRDEIVALGIPPEVQLSDELLGSWIGTWAQYAGTPPNWLDRLPWSRRAKWRRQLRRWESNLYCVLPPSFWNAVGQLDDGGRRKLSERLERCRYWLPLREERALLQARSDQIAQQFQQLRAELGQLAPELVPATDNLDDWMAQGERLREFASVAASASVAWAQRQRAAATRQEISCQLTPWQSAIGGVPIVNVWRHTRGAHADTMIRNLLASPSPEGLQRLRAVFLAGTFHPLIESWARAASAEIAARESSARAIAFPSLESHRAGWLARRPVRSLLDAEIGGSWPDEDQLRVQLESKSRSIERCRVWMVEERPRIVAQTASLRTEATKKLSESLELLRTCGDATAAEALVSRASQVDASWAEEEIRAAFRATDPAVLKAQIEGIDRDLERGSFDDAKRRWVKKAREDVDAQKAVSDLKAALVANNGNLKPSQIPIFRKALSLVPIWITTAQAAQAIPLAPDLFDIVVIDEASQCTLTNLLPLLYRGRRLVVIGDAEQLPAIPTIRSPEEQTLAKQHGVEELVSRFGHATTDVYKLASRVHPRGPAGTVMLTEHYRSHPQIIGFANKHIYQRALSLRREVPAVAAAGIFKHQVNGRAARTSDGTWCNQLEARAVVKLVLDLASQDLGSIGVVTPFRGQKDLIRGMLDDAGGRAEIMADTAYGFQGDEREVMIFSPVVAPGIDPGSARWVESPHNLVNVSLTRARLALHIVSDFGFLKTQAGILKHLAQYCSDIDLLRRSSDEELLLFSWMVMDGLDPRVHHRVDDLEVDFTLERPGVRVAIEVDGGQHAATKHADGARDSFLRARGYGVVRLAAVRVREEPFQCLAEIKRALGLAPHS